MDPVVVTQLIDLPADTVWNALTREAELKKWYFPVQDYIFEEGKEFTFYESEDSCKFQHRCKFLRIIPHQLIETTWEHPSHSKGVSVVCWEIAPVKGKTLVKLTHSGIENFADAGPEFSKENYEAGWKAIVKTTLRNYLYGIEKLVFEIDIRTSPENLWHKLWHNGNYTLWTEPFCEGSYISGKLAYGERVHFLTPSGEGMYSDVVWVVENQLVVFSHIGMMEDNRELPVDSETEKWTGCFETYKLSENGELTNLKVEVDAIPGYADYTKTAFPVALQRLKSLAENI